MKHSIFFFFLCGTHLCWSVPEQKVQQEFSNLFVKFIHTRMKDHSVKKRLIHLADVIKKHELVATPNNATLANAQQDFLSTLLPTAEDSAYIKQLPILENYEEPHPYDPVIKIAARLLLAQRNAAIDALDISAAIARLDIGLQAHRQIEQQLDELKRQEKERLADLAQKIKDNNHVTYDN